MRLIITLFLLVITASLAAADDRREPYRKDEVRDIQDRLIELHLVRQDFNVDGVYGGQTRDAIRAFQREHGLEPDGEAGPRTLEALFDEGREASHSGSSGPGKKCKDSPVSSVGDARPLESWAFKLARKNWREEVRFRYGEEWSNWDNAKVIEQKCEESSVGLIKNKRCRLVAVPCTAL